MVFAAGTQTNLSLTVQWRSGRHSEIGGVRSGCLYEIEEPDSAAGPPGAQATQPKLQPMFEDVSTRLKHAHRDEPFDELARQPLLPKRLSQLGPGVAWPNWTEMGGTIS